MTFSILTIASGPFQTNTYLILSSDTDEAVVVDPAPDSSEAIFELLDIHNKQLLSIWLTHSHWDHTACCSTLMERTSAELLVHKYDADNLISPGCDGIPCYVKMQPVTPTKYIDNADVLTVGNSCWEVIHTPGHSPGSVCFYNDEKGILISGDTLFAGTMGNVAFPTSSAHLMGTSLFRLSTLKPSTQIFPGHGETTLLKKELSWMLDAAEGLCEEQK